MPDMSFAQFEREVTGERIRDKIAASKQKGMWMGGFVPLGYEPDGRTLTINESEAETVRNVFRLYLEHGNVRRVKEEADRLDLTTKIRKSADGQLRGGRPLSRGYIYKLLSNPLYTGCIAHKGKTYDGQHLPIIDTETWDAVQAKLVANANERRSGSRAAEPSPLAGKLFDETGVSLSPSHAVKSGRRYRYYISRHLITGTADRSNDQQRGGWRLPAGEIERRVRETVIGLLADRSALAHAAREAGLAADQLPGLFNATARRKVDALDLAERIDLASDQIAITLNLKPLIGGQGPTIRQSIPIRIKRRGVEMRLVIEGTDNPSKACKPDPALIKAVVRAHKWFDDLVSGRAGSLTAIAEAEGLSDRYVSHLLPLAFLAPDIITAVLAGAQPVDLTVEALTKRTDLPLAWAEQKALLGFG